MKLLEIAHSRTGDKGDISNISVIAYDMKDYEFIKEKVTVELVAKGVHGFFIPGHLAQVQRFDGIGWFVHSWPSIHTLSSSTSSK